MSHSVKKRKTCGEKGCPWCKLRLGTIWPFGVLITQIEKVVVETHFMISLIKFGLKPITSMTLFKYPHSTRS